MKPKTLRYIRIGVSALFFTLVTLFFVDYAGALPQSFALVAKIQFLPALLAGSFITVAVLLLLTLLFGRIYCSSVCPLGVMQDIVSRISRRFRKNGKKKHFDYKRPHNILRYTILGITALCLVFGIAALPALIDPYSAYGRMAVNLLRPVYVWFNNLSAAVFGAEWFLKDEAVVQSVAALVVALVTFAIIVVMAWLGGRTYCNTVCPVGTVLGTLSRYSLFKVQIDTDKCNGCHQCGRQCKSSCIDSPDKKIDYSRCVMCFDCMDSCRQKALHYSPSWKTAAKTEKADNNNNDSVDESRRRFLLTSLSLTAAAATASSPLIAAVAGGNDSHRHPPIVPAGAGSAERLNKLCTACNLCVAKCPQKIIKPATMEYGLKGFLQPLLVYDNGYCDAECNVCSSVCPSGAIAPLSIEEKNRVSIGYAIYKPESCLVNTDGENCGNCARRCPSDAIEMIRNEYGRRVPNVDTDKCTGCGSCEYHCPTDAIHVEGFAVHRMVNGNAGKHLTH